MDEYLKYDELIGEYFITHKAVNDYVDAQPAELTAHFDNESKAYKALSHAVYRIIYNSYVGINQPAHIKFMQYKIKNNHENEKRYLLLAMIEMVRGALNSDMDLNAYTETDLKHYPETVVSELKNGRLIIPGEKDEA